MRGRGATTHAGMHRGAPVASGRLVFRTDGRRPVIRAARPRVTGITSGRSRAEDRPCAARRPTSPGSRRAAAALVLAVCSRRHPPRRPRRRPPRSPAPPAVPAVVLPPVARTAHPRPRPPTPDDAALVAAVTEALHAAPLGTDVTAVVHRRRERRRRCSAAARPAPSSRRAPSSSSPPSPRCARSGPRRGCAPRSSPGTSPAEIVLVGGGDATLTRDAGDAPPQLPAGQSARPASLAELATRTAPGAQGLRAPRASRCWSTTPLFTGPRPRRAGPTSYVATGVVSPVSALSADSGRSPPTPACATPTRPWRPAAASPPRLAAAGITVAPTVARRRRPPRPRRGGRRCSSPTVADLVERMLTSPTTTSPRRSPTWPAASAGGRRASRAAQADGPQVLEALGVPTHGRSRSSTAAGSRAATTSARGPSPARSLAASVDEPAGRAAPPGSLWPRHRACRSPASPAPSAERFDTAGTAPGRGVVRAKTGTLTGRRHPGRHGARHRGPAARVRLPRRPGRPARCSTPRRRSTARPPPSPRAERSGVRQGSLAGPARASPRRRVTRVEVVDWGLARTTARSFAPRGPGGTPEDARAAVADLRALARYAVGPVRERTGLDAGDAPAGRRGRPRRLGRQQRRRLPRRARAAARADGDRAARRRRPPSARRVTAVELGGVLALPVGQGARPVRGVHDVAPPAGCCSSRRTSSPPSGTSASTRATSGSGSACTRRPTGCSSAGCRGWRSTSSARSTATSRSSDDRRRRGSLKRLRAGPRRDRRRGARRRRRLARRRRPDRRSSGRSSTASPRS